MPEYEMRRCAPRLRAEGQLLVPTNQPPERAPPLCPRHGLRCSLARASRDITLPGQTCRNTVQGRLLITDDKGVLCSRDDLDHASGCCKAGDRHSCALCDTRDKCCSELEACVSCCLAPQHDAAGAARTAFRARGHAETGHFADAFEYCRGICRTHRTSTSHENSYIGARHHCFSQLGKPQLAAPLPPGALQGVSLLLSAAGDSCDAACRKQGKTCSEEHLRVADSCDRLRELTACEAGMVRLLAVSFRSLRPPLPLHARFVHLRPSFHFLSLR